jgi:TM2 domain-containing membrane protein YozV
MDTKDTPSAKSTKSQTVAFILNLFFGFIGVHKFYLGKPLLGFVYLLTWGFLFIGWTIDTFALAFMSKQVFAAKYNNGVESPRIGVWARILVLLPIISIGAGIFIVMGAISASGEKPTSGKTYSIGETIKESKFSFVINETFVTKTIGNQFNAPDGAIYVAAVYTYANAGKKPVSAFDAPELKLVDSNSVKYSEAIDATLGCNVLIDSTAKGLSDINPGIPLKECSVFEVSQTLFDQKTWRIQVDGTGRTSFVSFTKEVAPPASAPAPASVKESTETSTKKPPTNNERFVGRWADIEKNSAIWTCSKPLAIELRGTDIVVTNDGEEEVWEQDAEGDLVWEHQRSGNVFTLHYENGTLIYSQEGSKETITLSKCR